MIMTAFEADAKRMGRLEGRRDGIAEGETRGFADGAYQKALETAKNLLALGLSIENIAQATGLTKEEVQSI